MQRMNKGIDAADNLSIYCLYHVYMCYIVNNDGIKAIDDGE